MVTAPTPAKLIPRSNIGVSVWALILLQKFLYFQPLYRVLLQLRDDGLSLPAGTVTGGLQRLLPLFQPLYNSIVDYNRDQENRWHADETRWLVFVKRDDRAGFAWSLWVFCGQRSVVFVLDPTRSHEVPEDHFGPDAQGILNVDRYSAYKAMAQVKDGQILLSFCWAHVRRDFLGVVVSWGQVVVEWSMAWVEEIRELYRRNHARLQVLQDPAAFAEHDRLVRDQVEHLAQRCATELQNPQLHPACKKVLTSLQNHWSGLTLFVDHPEVPMDNNEAERRERGPVVARKNYYGSGALWSGRLAAMLFSIFQTLSLWSLCPRQWLAAFLQACAEAGGKVPANLQSYLPWNMTAEQRRQYTLPAPPPTQPPATGPPNTS